MNENQQKIYKAIAAAAALILQQIQQDIAN